MFVRIWSYHIAVIRLNSSCKRKWFNDSVFIFTFFFFPNCLGTDYFIAYVRLTVSHQKFILKKTLIDGQHFHSSNKWGMKDALIEYTVDKVQIL